MPNFRVLVENSRLIQKISYLKKESKKKSGKNEQSLENIFESSSRFLEVTNKSKLTESKYHTIS